MNPMRYYQRSILSPANTSCAVVFLFVCLLGALQVHWDRAVHLGGEKAPPKWLASFRVPAGWVSEPVDADNPAGTVYTFVEPGSRRFLSFRRMQVPNGVTCDAFCRYLVLQHAMSVAGGGSEAIEVRDASLGGVDGKIVEWTGRTHSVGLLLRVMILAAFVREGGNASEAYTIEL